MAERVADEAARGDRWVRRLAPGREVGSIAGMNRRAFEFRISATPLDPAELRRTLLDDQAGACVTFEGWVRNRNEGQPVLSLEYEAYATLAEKEGARILAEAQEKYALTGAAALHRTGHLQLGEIAVWVGVTAPHRGAAFDACRYIIDEAKARLPVWKKEHYTSGSTVWINGATRGAHAQDTGPTAI